MMSVSNERAELHKQKAGLESTIMTMTSEGIAVPSDIADSLIHVQTRLQELGGAANVKSWTAWLGQTIEDFTLTDCLSRGSYSNIFRARNYSTGKECAFKVSYTDDKLPISSKEYFSKQALSFNDEIVQQVEITANEALQLGAEKLQSDTTGAFVKVLSEGMCDKYFYYKMPLLQGQSLKELAVLTDAVLTQLLPEIFSRLAELLGRVSASELRYHGNLQPDNILITRTDAVLLSPGVFDAHSAIVEQKFQLSTPAYYPFYEANDVFALGCILWEMICKKHPLYLNDNEERLHLFAHDMRQMLEYRKALNHEPLCNFSRMKTPSEIRPNLSDSAEIFLMKAIKLRFDHEGYITADPGFKTALEMAEALEKVSKLGLLRHS